MTQFSPRRTAGRFAHSVRELSPCGAWPHTACGAAPINSRKDVKTLELVSFKLPDDFKLWLKQEAAARQINMSILMRQLVRTHIEDLMGGEPIKNLRQKIDELEGNEDVIRQNGGLSPLDAVGSIGRESSSTCSARTALH